MNITHVITRTADSRLRAEPSAVEHRRELRSAYLAPSATTVAGKAAGG
jgi:hypothetical protein